MKQRVNTVMVGLSTIILCGIILSGKMFKSTEKGEAVVSPHPITSIKTEPVIHKYVAPEDDTYTFKVIKHNLTDGNKCLRVVDYTVFGHGYKDPEIEDSYTEIISEEAVELEKGEVYELKFNILPMGCWEVRILLK